MSPFAIAGRIDKDIVNEAAGDETPTASRFFCHELWPSDGELPRRCGMRLTRKISSAATPPILKRICRCGATLRAAREFNINGAAIPPTFKCRRFWQSAPFRVRRLRGRRDAGDSVTTDHISPAGAIKPSSPAGDYLRDKGIKIADYNSYGARRGNHEVMMRGTFANVRIQNLMTPGRGRRRHPAPASGERMSIFDAAVQYQKTRTPLLIFAGREYGTGSSRDWAAKGARCWRAGGGGARVMSAFTAAIGGNGRFAVPVYGGRSLQSLNLRGDESFDLEGADGGVTPRQTARLLIHRADGTTDSVELLVRVDTQTECEYFAQDGILPFVLEQLTG